MGNKIEGVIMKQISKQLIKDTITDMVSNLLYYNRKDDEELEVGDIEKAIKDGVITVDEICELFKNEFIRGIQ